MKFLPWGMLHFYNNSTFLNICEERGPAPERKETQHIRYVRYTETWCFAWHLLPLRGFFFFSLWEASTCFYASASEVFWVFFPAALIQRNLPRLSVFRHGGWSSTIPEALGSSVISWLSEHNGWKLSYYLSVLSKGKGSCGAERPRKTLVLILLKGVGQPSQILFS